MSNQNDILKLRELLKDYETKISVLICENDRLIKLLDDKDKEF